MRFLGVITVATTLTKNNSSTAVPFTLPSGYKALYLESDTDGVQFAIGGTADANSPMLFNAKDAFTQQGPFFTGSANNAPVISVYNSTSGTVNVKVFGGCSANA